MDNSDSHGRSYYDETRDYSYDAVALFSVI